MDHSARQRNIRIGCLGVIGIFILAWIVGSLTGNQNSEAPTQSAVLSETPDPTAWASVDRSINEHTDNGNYNNPADPYSKQSNDAIIDAYVAARADYLAKIEMLYFAADCGVLFSTDRITGEQNADIARHDAAMVLYDVGQQNVVTALDMHLDQMERRAVGEARDNAAKSGACDYWQQNPEMVAEVRQEVTAALAAVQ